MSRHIVMLFSVLFMAQVYAAPLPIATISKADFGAKWAFTREEVQLRCGQDHALYVINPSTLAQYPLNSKALDLMRSGKVMGEPLEKILLDDPVRSGEKMSLTPFIIKAEQLCR